MAFLSILATSVISTINVLCPDARSSEAPTLVNILSTSPTSADDAGTKEPICDISTMSAVCLIYVDLPAIFGPVMTDMRFFLSFRNVSLAINMSFGIIFSTTGCRPSLMSITPFSFILGRT